eukprot:1843439-Prymnesium_polylepis.1
MELLWEICDPLSCLSHKTNKELTAASMGVNRKKVNIDTPPLLAAYDSSMTSMIFDVDAMVLRPADPNPKAMPGVKLRIKACTGAHTTSFSYWGVELANVKVRS